MPHEELVDAHGITEIIGTLSAKHASGRLEILAGGNEGALLFRSGKLVAARIGHLTGFQAINALASMRDGRFQFDPSAAVPAISAITPSERRVLKQFFGIEAADSHEQPAPAPVEDVSEATVITSSAPSEVIDDDPIEVAAAIYARPRVRYVTVLALGVLLIAVVAGAVLLREKFRERSSVAAVATKTEPAAASSQPVTAPVSTTAPAQPVVNEELPVNKEQPVKDEPRIAETRQAATPDLTGEWNVINTVDATSYRSFQNLRIGFALSINQSGTTFTAKGLKVSENGRRLPANSRTPIELKGVINGDRIEATFYEQGTTRKTNGRFVWKIDRAGGLKGTFASSAARTSGKSTARREL
jgi:hypothetical protein